MSTILRLEHKTRMADRGPGTAVFGQGIYEPCWDIRVPNGCARRWPRWQNDRVLSTRKAELEPEYLFCEVKPCWYFGFADMDQLRRWFSVSFCRKFSYASAGVVIRQYIGTNVIVGDKQSVMHFQDAVRGETFHVYTGKELKCPSTVATPTRALTAGLPTETFRGLTPYGSKS